MVLAQGPLGAALAWLLGAGDERTDVSQDMRSTPSRDTQVQRGSMSRSGAGVLSPERVGSRTSTHG